MTPFDPSRIVISYIKLQRDFSLIFLNLSRLFLTLHLPKPPSLILNLFPTQSLASRVISSSGMIFLLTFYHAFHLFWRNFWDFLKNLGFLKIDEVFAKFLDGFCLNDLKCSCIASHLHFQNLSCIIDVCLLYWNHVCL